MKRRLAIGTGLGLLLATATASAERPFTEEKVSLSGQIGYGAYLDDGDLNPYSLGFGFRGGYTFDPNIYVGGLFDFFIGESDEINGPFGVGNVDASANAWLFQVEGGYDFGVTRTIVIRPKLGLGATTVNSESCASAPIVGQGCVDDSDGEFTVGLGAEALFDLDPVYIAPELRFNLGGDVSALIVMVGIGGAI